jgi:hypothetical protein
VLQHAAKLPPHRIAGYAANAEFWLSEIEHCFAVIDGYEKRFYAMRHATTAYIADHALESELAGTDTSTRHNIKDFQLKELRDSVAAAGRTFFRRCRELELVSPELLHSADRLLNLEYED